MPGVIVGFLAHCWFSINQAGKADPHQQHEDLNLSCDVLPPLEEELKMVMCVNQELGMRSGKIAAQCAHAAVAVVEEVRRTNKPLLKQWQAHGAAKIALKCPNQTQLLQLREAARDQGIPCYLVTDAGRTQIAAGSNTVLAIGPWGKSRLDAITGHLRLL